MRLTSNNFAGELPKTFARLTKLKDFRISDNSFFGKMPNFIQNWTNLEKLVIQGSGLMGPIPTGISLLTNLTDLRITDLNGLGSPFPQLNNIKMLKTLMLRNCNISGQLPAYLGAMKKLKTLDLSFNKLTGEIPISFSGLAMVDYMFLTGNMLTGSVPSWLQGSNIDLSYNDFTIDQGGLSVSCPKSEKCPKYFYSLHINCGGNEVTLYENSTTSTKATTFEDDSNRGGPSSFYQSTKWASSNTGFFTDDTRPTNTFIWTNSSRISMTNPQLYMNARLSPISLTYYGFCLGNGIYIVNLHFAEIIFTDDKTYSSLGRRVFDIYIQGSLVKKDFNIANEAGGFGKAVVKNFTAHITTNNTLEIRLFWAGKGTTGIPYGGVYGPLISAISVYSNFNAPAENGSEGRRSISKGKVVGIMSGIIFLLLLILVFFGY